MRAVVDVLPLTALADGLRKIALEEQSLFSAGLMPEVIVLTATLILTVVFSKKLFRWY